MRILLAIAHYYHPQGDGKYSSASPNAQARLNAVTSCIAALHQVLGKRHHLLDIFRRLAVPVNQHQGHDLDVVVVTTGDRHLLKNVPLPSDLYRHAPVDVTDPLFLAFETHGVLRDGLARGYDYYGYLEEDLVVRDPLFLTKLQWFTRQAGDGALLLPRRYEVTFHGPVHKLYLDGAIRKGATAQWQNVDEQAELNGSAFDQPIRFVRPLNPHSGCFFLNAAQMAHWAGQPYFLDRDASFIGPLESAASLGIMRTFRVYKPAPENADFLEIHHYDSKHLAILGRAVQVAGVDDTGTDAVGA